MIIKKGISASPGVAIGPAFVLDTEDYRIPRRTVEPSQAPEQLRILDAALEASRQELAELRVATARRLGEQAAMIFAFHEAFIAEPGLRRAIVQLIERQHYTAAFAFSNEMNRRQREFRAVADAYLKERVKDLQDVERRVLRNILGRAREDITRLTQPVIIVAHDLTPSQAVSIDRAHVLGFALNVGGQTSHVALIAKLRGIPAVVALNDITSDVTGGELLVLDGSHGIVVCDPDDANVERYRESQAEHRRQEIHLKQFRGLPSVTRDDVRVTLHANIELPEEVDAAIEAGAEGVGLYRSEFLFLAATRPPTEDEQYEAFLDAVKRVKGAPIVIRTIDLGADKISAAVGPSRDPNPDLGLRSLRYCLQHLDLFKQHLRAILRASAAGDVRIMFPMVTTLMELRQAKATVADVMEDLEEDGIAFRHDVPIGMMIETPAAALLSESFAREAAFFSIGTNDLTEYTLAVDRANERVAHLYAPHNPAVLRLLRMIIDSGAAAGVPVSLCGEMAGSPLYCKMLVGMGLRQLSMAPQDIPEIKRVIRSTTLPDCQEIARRALGFDNDRELLNYLRDVTREDDPERL
ncbi:MAG: phosphoenolpyruvate--protein phosphotransferase [Planctomycetia bacterium]|nr:MAG: phosphoenolpyruvate--protein phosphotransferase [Planctomycetia bacterium]